MDNGELPLMLCLTIARHNVCLLILCIIAVSLISDTNPIYLDLNRYEKTMPPV